MDRRFYDLYCEFAHGHIERRSFLERLTVLAGSTAAATSVLPLIENDMAKAITILETDPRIKVETVPIPGGPATFTSYLVTPTFAGKPGPKPAKLPAIIVVGENRSTNPNIKDITRRWAAEGFMALGVDYLSPVGGTPDDMELAGAMTGKLNPTEVLSWFKLASKYLRARPDVGKIGIVGYCWGGGIINDLIIEDPILDAAVGYYGRNPDLKQVDKIRAPLLFHYGGRDQNILLNMPAYDEALTKAGKLHTFYVYPGAEHGFHNETNAGRFNPVASLLAWDRSLAFFRKYLEG